MSQPSSPTQSRTGSPTRHQQSSHRNSRGPRNTRQSNETTPPPIVSNLTQGSGTLNNYMGNEILVQTLSKNFDDVSLVEKSSSHKHKILKTRFSSKDN